MQKYGGEGMGDLQRCIELCCTVCQWGKTLQLITICESSVCH